MFLRRANSPHPSGTLPVANFPTPEEIVAGQAAVKAAIGEKGSEQRAHASQLAALGMIAKEEALGFWLCDRFGGAFPSSKTAHLIGKRAAERLPGAKEKSKWKEAARRARKAAEQQGEEGDAIAAAGKQAAADARDLFEQTEFSVDMERPAEPPAPTPPTAPPPAPPTAPPTAPRILHPPPSPSTSWTLAMSQWHSSRILATRKSRVTAEGQERQTTSASGTRRSHRVCPRTSGHNTSSSRGRQLRRRVQPTPSNGKSPFSLSRSRKIKVTATSRRKRWRVSSTRTRCSGSRRRSPSLSLERRAPQSARGYARAGMGALLGGHGC